jgi:hypothetical protein
MIIKIKPFQIMEWHFYSRFGHRLQICAIGVILGEMNTKLLQKMEELTLYMVEINNEVSKLKTSNTKLIEDNAILQTKIKDLKKE